MSKYRANIAHLLIRQPMNLLQLPEQQLILLAQRGLRRRTLRDDEQQPKDPYSGHGAAFFRVR